MTEPEMSLTEQACWLCNVLPEEWEPDPEETEDDE